jgi:hypothetical protein
MEELNIISNNAWNRRSGLAYIEIIFHFLPNTFFIRIQRYQTRKALMQSIKGRPSKKCRK